MSEDHAAVTGRPRHIVLNSHPTGDQSPIAMHWGAADAVARGPIVTNLSGDGRHNAIAVSYTHLTLPTKA